MKALVVYDSNFGNTQEIAETIAAEIGAKAIKITAVNPSDLSGLDLLIVGTPIIGWKPTIKTQSFLDKLPKLSGVRATAFDTRVKLFIHGDAMGKVANALKNCGADIVVDPVAFYVAGPQQSPYLLSGELEKAKKWGAEIIAKIK
jgi:flavodoxin